MNPRASSREPGKLTASIEARRVAATFPAGTRPLELHVALLGFDIKTKIEHGENRNSTLSQEFVVLAHVSYLSSDGHWDLPLPRGKSTASRYGIALWVSESGNPAPLQATGGWLPGGVSR